MLFNKLIKTQQKLIDLQLINKNKNVSIIEAKLNQHLLTSDTDVNLLESIYLLEIISNDKSILKLNENEHKVTTLFNKSSLYKTNLNLVLLLMQLFLVPEIKKNAFKLDIVDTDLGLIIKNFKYKNFKNIPSCYYN